MHDKSTSQTVSIRETFGLENIYSWTHTDAPQGTALNLCRVPPGYDLINLDLQSIIFAPTISTYQLPIASGEGIALTWTWKDIHNW